MAPQRAEDSNKSAKEVLDEFGQQVYDEIVKKEVDGTGASGDAKKYIEELKGNLKEAKGIGETVGFHKTCDIINDKGDKLLGARGDPCGNTTGKEDVKRFSDKEGAECTKSKIKDSEKDGVGACAPFRRLNLCNKNMVKMDTNNDSKAKNDLLAEVCLAAKYEGESIKTHYPQYQEKYGDTGHTTCTMLARSFADIGDIVRGKDLYLGNKKKKQKETEREKLEKNLKKIFGKIHDDVTTNGKKGAKDRYKDTDNYYQLREDWWTANRHTVWKAITCKADTGNAYFRPTCIDGNSKSQAKDKCRCKKNDGKNETDQVPTYFDYVPQFLRWFEEWAEDFCRKKKKYVNIVKTYCRKKDNSSEERYCSRNGYDCEKTKRAIGKYRMGKQCISCLYACNPYVDWINNQRKQFDKQVKKYADEIKIYTNGGGGSGRTRQTRRARSISTDDNGYEKIFYKKLQETEYKVVGKFLEKLSKDKECEKVDDEEGGRINFEKVNSTSGGTAVGGASDTSGTNVESQGTFYRSKYCQPCPHCGMKKTKDGNGWEKKKEPCEGKKLYKPNEGAPHTPINFLYSGDRHDDIEKKLKKFCDEKKNDTPNSNGNSVASGSAGRGRGRGGHGDEKKSDKDSLYEEWKCYEFKHLDKVVKEDDEDYDKEYDNDVQTGGGLCILQKTKGEENVNKQKTSHEIQKTYNDFFNFWVAHMLKDSIYWKKKLERCLENGTKKCGKNCKDNCDCFQNWITQKKEQEWSQIKKHFYTQEDIKNQTQTDPGVTLEWVLRLEFLKDESTEDTQNSLDSEEIKHLKEINKMLEKENAQQTAGGAPVTGKKTLMDKLIEHEEGEAKKCKDCPKPQDTGVARSAVNPQTPVEPHGEVDDEDEDDDEDEEEEEEKEKEEKATEVTEGTGATEDDNVEKVCATVDKALNNKENLNAACSQKYAPPQRHWGWKCIPSGSDTGSTTSSEAKSRTTRAAPGVKSGSGKDGAICVPPRRRRLYVGKLTQWAKEQSQSLETSDQKTPSEKLRTAFIQSAAIETFFLWHKYKVENTKTQSGSQLQTIIGSSGDDEDNNPQTLLQSGNIPTDFLRQMFYTLGDYRDICVGNTGIVINASTEDQKAAMEKIQQEIDKILKQSGEQPSTSGTQQQTERKTWWNKHGPDIWNGMICALTYNTNSGGEGKTTTISQDGTLKEKLLDGEGKKPQKHQYEYKNVKLDEHSGTEAKPAEAPASGEKTTLNNPKLKDFVEIPTYFRWLHEWGNEFCVKRARMLKQVEKNCTQDGEKQYSGYGEDCETIFSQKYNVLQDLSWSCAKPCRLYKTWIEKKKTEYEKQKKEYGDQKKDAKSKSGNISDHEFVGKLDKDYASIKLFLHKLGPCSKTDNDNGKGKKIFDDEGDTFKHAKNCDPCPKFTVDCKNGKCDNDKGGGCDSKNSITANDIETMGQPTEINMLVSDNSGNGFNDLPECKDAHIFKGIRKEQWTCGNVCGYVVCKPKNGNGKNDGENPIITITALVTHWVQNFLEDYNKIKHKISHCTNTVEGSTCIKDCVEKWVQQKRKEWENIKERFNEQYNVNGSDDYNVRSVLEPLVTQIGAANDKAEHETLEKLEKSLGCNCTETSEKKADEKNIIDCMLKKLEKKISECTSQASEETQAKCENASIPLPNEEEEIPEENPVTQPNICPQQETPAETVEDKDACKAAPKEPAPTAPSGELQPQPQPEPPEEKAPAASPVAPPAPPQPPSQPKPTPPYLSPPP